MKYIISSLFALTLVGCQATNTVKYSVFPIEPNWQTYTRPPIVKSVEAENGDSNFEVSEELIKKAIQQTRYLEKIKEWRVMNNVP